MDIALTIFTEDTVYDGACPPFGDIVSSYTTEGECPSIQWISCPLSMMTMTASDSFDEYGSSDPIQSDSNLNHSDDGVLIMVRVHVRISSAYTVYPVHTLYIQCIHCIYNVYTVYAVYTLYR